VIVAYSHACVHTEEIKIPVAVALIHKPGTPGFVRVEDHMEAFGKNMT
jgi:hypothetical protein